MNDIEQQFQGQPLRPLPDAWKEAILDKACETPTVQTHTPRHRSPFELLFAFVPKPVAIPLATAWTIIAALWFSTPTNPPSSIARLVAGSPSAVANDEYEEALRVRTMIWVALHEDLETHAEFDGDSEAFESNTFPAGTIVLP